MHAACSHPVWNTTRLWRFVEEATIPQTRSLSRGEKAGTSAHAEATSESRRLSSCCMQPLNNELLGHGPWQRKILARPAFCAFLAKGPTSAVPLRVIDTPTTTIRRCIAMQQYIESSGAQTGICENGGSMVKVVLREVSKVRPTSNVKP